MKQKLLIIIISIFILSSGMSLGEDKVDVKEIIQKVTQALEVTSKIKDVKLLKYSRTIPKSKRDVNIYIRRPNKIFKAYQPDGLILLFDGKRAFVLKGKNPAGKIVKKPEILPKEHWWHFEIDIALIYPLLFDFPVKYNGIEKIEDTEHYNLSAKMPLGTELNYYINSKTHLIYKVNICYNNQGNPIKIEKFFTDYRSADGILLPHTIHSFSKKTGEKIIKTFRSIKINPKLENVNFQVPKGL